MATLTLKNVPAGLVAKLKAGAAQNGRSLNRETIARLEDSARPHLAITLAELDEALALQAAAGVWVDPVDVDRFIEEGRL